jgi:uncharacterized membrane protein YkoI
MVRMKRKLLIVVAAIAGAVGIAAGSIFAYEHFASRERGRSVQTPAGGVLPLVRILDLAAQHVPGEVLKVELENEHEHLQYEIKVLAGNGRVREIKLDARSGAVLEIEDD